MDPATALTLVVFGRGVTCSDDGYQLTAASAARVQAAVDYVAAHAAAFTRAGTQDGPPRIVFSGGWAEACVGAAQPPAGHREGDLMLRQAQAAGLDRFAELHAETGSRSTLENLIRTVESGLLAGQTFDARRPLGIVSHGWHLPRVRFLAGRVLRLSDAALLDVQATGGEARQGWMPERALRFASRLCFAGVHDPAGMLRRERRVVASARRAERLLRRGPAPGTISGAR
jgi:hypothetical protein